jgi:hypothetical protein
MIRDLVFLSPLHPTLGATERRNLGTDVLAPISFLPWWDDAAQCQAFDLIRGLIEILVPFTSTKAVRRPAWLTCSVQNAESSSTDSPTSKVAIEVARRNPILELVHFDEVFRSEGIRVIKTGVRSPRANAFAERWVRTVRSECLDWVLVLSHGHLERVLRTYVSHYNRQRPHRGIDLGVPVPGSAVTAAPPSLHVDRHDVLGGLIHEYRPVAA